jgi:hypothetical protein
LCYRGITVLYLTIDAGNPSVYVSMTVDDGMDKSGRTNALLNDPPSVWTLQRRGVTVLKNRLKSIRKRAVVAYSQHLLL